MTFRAPQAVGRGANVYAERQLPRLLSCQLALNGGYMTRTLQWLIAVVVPLTVFGVCLVLLMVLRLPWTPHAESDRWLMSLSVAAFTGTGIAAPLVWWAGRAKEPDSGEQQSGEITQRAKADRKSRITMAGRDVWVRGGGDEK